MVKSLYYGIGGFLLLGVVTALFLLYKSVEKPTTTTEYKTDFPKEETPQPKDFGWIQSLGKQQALSYTFPVDELNIKFSLKELTRPKRVIQVSAQTVDSYQYFCILQIFKQNDLEYSILKQEERFVANIMDIEDSTVERLEKSLKYYEIDYKINSFYTKDY
jgi:hypothetical protein